MIEIDGHLNYDEKRDMYWHGILGWVPEYVEKLKGSPDQIGINEGKLYRYIYHTGDWGEEVHVYFRLVTKKEGIDVV